MADLSNLKKKKTTKGAPPAPVATNANLDKPVATTKVAMQLKISPELRNQFKAYAAERNLEISTLFEQVWDYYRENHG